MNQKGYGVLRVRLSPPNDCDEGWGWAETQHGNTGSFWSNHAPVGHASASLRYPAPLPVEAYRGPPPAFEPVGLFGPLRGGVNRTSRSRRRCDRTLQAPDPALLSLSPLRGREVGSPHGCPTARPTRQESPRPPVILLGTDPNRLGHGSQGPSSPTLAIRPTQPSHRRAGSAKPFEWPHAVATCTRWEA